MCDGLTFRSTQPIPPSTLAIDEAKLIARQILAGAIQANDGCTLIAHICESNNYPQALIGFSTLAHEQYGHEEFGFDADNSTPLIIQECNTLLESAP